MNCFTKALAIAPVVFGLGLAAAGVDTVTWQPPTGTVAGAEAESAATIGTSAMKAVGTLMFAPAPLAAQGVTCEYCMEVNDYITCGDMLNQFPGGEVPDGSPYGEYCDGVPPSTWVETAHSFDTDPPWVTCGPGGGDPDEMILGMGGGTGSGCRACGGESKCHDYWDAGPCHVECEDPEFAMALDGLMGTGDVEGAVALILASHTALHFVDEDGVFRIASACGSGLVYAELGRDSELAVAVRAVVEMAAGA